MAWGPIRRPPTLDPGIGRSHPDTATQPIKYTSVGLVWVLTPYNTVRACVCVCVRAVAGAGGGEPAAAGWSGAAAAGGGRRSVEHEGGCGGAVGRGRRRAAVPTHLRAVGRASPVPSCRQAGLHTTSVRRVFAHWQHCTVALDDSFSLTGCGYNRSCKVPADGETLRNVSESCPELLTEHS